jgi:polyhydroxyalkanoate synthesis regulator phasin
MVHAQKAKRSAPSTSSGTSTEPGEGMEDEALQEGAMTAEELKALEAEELKKKQESERKKAAEQEERDAKNAARDAEIAAKGKRAAGGVHKFDP